MALQEGTPEQPLVAHDPTVPLLGWLCGSPDLVLCVTYFRNVFAVEAKAGGDVQAVHRLLAVMTLEAP